MSGICKNDRLFIVFVWVLYIYIVIRIELCIFNNWRLISLFVKNVGIFGILLSYVVIKNMYIVGENLDEEGGVRVCYDRNSDCCLDGF